MPRTNTSRVRGKRWCFTLNNYTSGETQLLSDLFVSEHVSYAIFGREISQTGTPHLQGYVHFSDRKEFNQAKSLLGSRCHLEVSRGTPKEASDYCKKDGDFTEFGSLNADSQQGKRNDWERLRDFLQSGSEYPSDSLLYTEFPSLMGRYSSGVRGMVKALYRGNSNIIGNPNGWQRDLEQLLSGQPDDRRIQFVVDEKGNNGKSWFIKYMLEKRPGEVQKLCIGKRDDLAHAIDEACKYFFIDVPRGESEYLQYSVLEMMKDGYVFSPKYESRTKKLSSNVFVVVMMNEYPNMRKLTGDRYHIIDLNAPPYSNLII
jgi:hypothetical protein